MAITNKAEAEALSVEELKTELESRGEPTEGLKQAAMLEVLLNHLDTVAAPNGGSKEETAASNGASKNEPAPENGVSKEDGDGSKDAPVSVEEEPKKDDSAEAPSEVTTEEAADKPCEESVAPAADGAVPTRTVDEVSGGTEMPDAKKTKADADPETAEPAKTAEAPAETPAETPAAESAA